MTRPQVGDFEVAIGATNKATVIEYFDGLGRVLRSETLEPGTSKAFVDRQYALCSCTGKTSKVSMPYRSGQTVYWTETQYDGMGRIRKVIPPDGTATSNFTEYRYKVEKPAIYTCSGLGYYGTRLMVGVFDAKGIGRVQSYDPEGSLKQVREDADSNFSSSYITDYGPWYDTNYVIKGTTKYTRYSYGSSGQGSQTRWQQFDSLGRLRIDRNPENETVTLAHDDAGNVRTRTDYRNIVTTTLYDEINRPTDVTFSDLTPDIVYTYDDVATYGKGRLRSVSNSTATSTYSYNNMGQLTREDKMINGVSFYTTYGYNLAGAVTTTRLPNAKTITNNYDTVGRLSSVTSNWSDSNHPGTLASSFVYHASQAITRVNFGNGTRMTRTFNSGLQLKTLKHGTSTTPGSLVDLEYNYQETVSNNGRIMGITNYKDRTKDLSFTYDRLYRLATAQTAGTHWGLSWTYDRYGNRLTQSVTKGTAPTSSLTYNDSTNRVNGWTYDNAGNTTNDGRHVYTWNALNQQITMDGTTEYRYDAQGNRVMKITPTKTTYYFFGMGEYSGGVWEKLYVSLNGQKLIEYSNGTTYFFHCDHLGTPRVQTNVSAAVVETWEAYPFGEQWTMTGGVGNKHRYTGKERDTESANDYFGARYYWNGAARWLSVDPEGGRASNPQGLNGYSYIDNDPVNFVDVGGRFKAPPVEPGTSGSPYRNFYFLDLGEIGEWGGFLHTDPPIDEFPKDGEPGQTLKNFLRMPAALDIVNKALKNKKCADLFGTVNVNGQGYTASQVLADLTSNSYAGGKLGGIAFSPTWPGKAENKPKNWIAGTARSEKFITFSQSQVVIVVNSSEAGVAELWNLGTDLNNANTLLHELGHAMNFLGGKTGIINDEFDPDGSKTKANDSKIETDCFQQ